MRYVTAILLLLLSSGIWPSATQGVAPESSKKGHPKSDPPLSPAAEKTGRTAPVELTLKILETHIKPGQRLWYQVVVRNIGTQEIHIKDRFLFNPFMLKQNLRMRTFIYLVVLGPDGAELPLAWLGRSVMADVPISDSDPWVADLNAKAKELREKGLSKEEIEERLSEYEAEPRRVSWVELSPGESIASLPWAYNPYYSWSKRKSNERKPRGDFSELPFFALESPGKYRIKAVFDQGPVDYDALPDDLKEILQGHKRDAGEMRAYGSVRTETPWIDIHVEQ